MSISYVKFILVLIIIPNQAISIGCVTTEKKRLNDKELLNKVVTDKPKPRSRCCPYDFDRTLCKIVGDRLLCGYNRNIGGYINDNEFKELENGCRIRGGRVECGYVKGPFTNPRRPPAMDNNSIYNEVIPKTTINDGSEVIEDGKSKIPLKQVTPENLYFGTTRCLEIRERIVCRHN